MLCCLMPCPTTPAAKSLHSGEPDDYMAEIPTVVVEPLPPEYQALAAVRTACGTAGLFSWIAFLAAVLHPVLLSVLAATVLSCCRLLTWGQPSAERLVA